MTIQMKVTGNGILLSCNVCLVLALVVGCGENSEQPQAAIPAGATRPYTKVELDRLIVPGMEMGEVTNVFGPAASRLQTSEHAFRLRYAFPLETVIQEGGPRMTGFNVHFKEGKVVMWSPIMGESIRTVQPSDSPSSFGEQSFQLFVATGGLTNVARAINSEGSADASDLKVAPDLTLKAKVFAGNSDNGRPDEQTVMLVLNEEDASRLAALSKRNLGKRLLIVCREKAIAAPTMSVPLVSRQLTFTVKDAAVLNILQNR